VTAGSPLADGQEVVCHGDLGPHNFVFDGDAAVGIIDWDASVGPGLRLVDLGHAVWCCADVGEWVVRCPSKLGSYGACARPTAGPMWPGLRRDRRPLPSYSRRPRQGWSGEGRRHLREEGPLNGSERGGAEPACYASGLLIALLRNRTPLVKQGSALPPLHPGLAADPVHQRDDNV
jgi:phosphotransferase family enzyme